MSQRALVRALGGAAVMLAPLGAWATWRALPVRPPATPMRWTVPSLTPPVSRDSLAKAASSVINGDPFRLDRHPASVAYRSGGSEKPAQPIPSAPPKPDLTVSGIVGGPPWQALLDGVPGHNRSLLVRAGDTLGGLRVRAITQTTVTITGLDTMWTLSLKRAWP